MAAVDVFQNSTRGLTGASLLCAVRADDSHYISEVPFTGEAPGDAGRISSTPRKGGADA